MKIYLQYATNLVRKFGDQSPLSEISILIFSRILKLLPPPRRPFAAPSSTEWTPTRRKRRPAATISSILRSVTSMSDDIIQGGPLVSTPLFVKIKTKFQLCQNTTFNMISTKSYASQFPNQRPCIFASISSQFESHPCFLGTDLLIPLMSFYLSSLYQYFNKILKALVRYMESIKLVYGSR